MSTSPVGPTSHAPSAGVGESAATVQNNPQNFRSVGSGSTTAQLIIGKIAQVRVSAAAGSLEAQSLNFREQLTPSSAAQQLMQRFLGETPA